MCAVDFPPEISEIDAAKLTLLPSEKVEIPRIAEAPAALECRHYTTLEVSAAAPPRDRRGGARPCARRPVGQREDAHRHDAYRPLARLFGNFYASLGEPFTHVRQSYEEWLAEQGKSAQLVTLVPCEGGHQPYAERWMPASRA